MLLGVAPDAFLTWTFKTDTELPPRNNFQNIFPYEEWGNKGDKMGFPKVWRIISIYNWTCFLVANLRFILLNHCQLHFFCMVPSTYGGQSNDLLFALDSVCIDWVSSCVPLNLISTWCLSMWTTTSQRAAGSTLLDRWGLVRNGRVLPHCLSNTIPKVLTCTSAIILRNSSVLWIGRKNVCNIVTVFELLW